MWVAQWSTVAIVPPRTRPPSSRTVVFSRPASPLAVGEGRGDHGERPVPGQRLGDELRGEALVDVDGLGVAEQLGGRGRDPRLLRDVHGGAEGEGGLETGGLHGVGAAMGTPDQTVLLQHAQIAAHGLPGHPEVRGELADVDDPGTPRHVEDLPTAFLRVHTASPASLRAWREVLQARNRGGQAWHGTDHDRMCPFHERYLSRSASVRGSTRGSRTPGAARGVPVSCPLPKSWPERRRA